MPTYEFRCPECGIVVAFVQGMDDDHTPPPCGSCRVQMNRIYDAAFHCDEIRGTKYIAPDGTERKDHGKYFDMGMGEWIYSKQDRRDKMQAKGLKEYGPEQVNPPK